MFKEILTIYEKIKNFKWKTKGKKRDVKKTKSVFKNLEK